MVAQKENQSQMFWVQKLQHMCNSQSLLVSYLLIGVHTGKYLESYIKHTHHQKKQDYANVQWKKFKISLSKLNKFNNYSVKIASLLICVGVISGMQDEKW